MADKGSVHSGHVKRRSKQLDRKMYEAEVDKLMERCRELEEDLRSLNLKIPDKEALGTERNELLQKLNDVKFSREEQFKEKRLVDADLKAANTEIQTKFDMIAKLKSNLRYKNQERVDEVIRKLEKQLSKPDMKSLEQRRLHQEISELRGSKEKILDFKKAEEEVHILKENQKDLRRKRDENVRLITALKQEEAAAKSLVNKHKQLEDETWATYKENLSKRDKLRNEQDSLQQGKRELTDKFRKVSRSFRNHEKLVPKQELEERSKEMHARKMKIVVERKKLFDEEISECDILLSYLDKYNSQTSTTVPEDHSLSSNENLSPTQRNLSKKDVISSDDIYRGVRRRPSKKERRRRHTTELKKIDLHVTVLERFMSLGVRPPTCLAEVQTAIDQLQEKKAFFKSEQDKVTRYSEMRRAKSNPLLGPNAPPLDSERNQATSSTYESLHEDETHNRKTLLKLEIHKRHMSCPSILSELADGQSAEIDSPCSSINVDFSASNSEYEPDSPISVTSSTSFGDFKDNGRDNEDNVDLVLKYKSEFEGILSKTGHKVHFANEISKLQNVEISKSNLPSMDQIIDCLRDENIAADLGNEVQSDCSAADADVNADANVHHKRITIIDVDGENDLDGFFKPNVPDGSEEIAVGIVEIPSPDSQLTKEVSSVDCSEEKVKEMETFEPKTMLEPLEVEEEKPGVKEPNFDSFHLEKLNNPNCENLSYKRSEDADFMLFQMEDESPSDNRHGYIFRDIVVVKDDTKTPDAYRNEALPRTPRRSSSGCSPRYTIAGQDFLYLDQNSDEVVQVIT